MIFGTLLIEKAVKTDVLKNCTDVPGRCDPDPKER